MENVYARRNFIKSVAITTTGVALLSSTSIMQAFNGNESPFEGYNPYAEEKTDLRKFSFIENSIIVKGTLFDKSSLQQLSKATVEVWHLSPNSKKYNHQAKMKVNEKGEYSFITDFPNNETGRYPKVFFKISTNEKTYFTSLSLTKDNAFIDQKHYEENSVLGEKRFPTNQQINNQATVTFNIVV
jgi:protocatechuate 3,4-dioxygenase beta subunit